MNKNRFSPPMMKTILSFNVLTTRLKVKFSIQLLIASIIQFSGINSH